jgi:hypothetical protein
MVVCGHFLYFFQFWYAWNNKNLATLVLGKVPKSRQKFAIRKKLAFKMVSTLSDSVNEAIIIRQISIWRVSLVSNLL